MSTKPSHLAPAPQKQLYTTATAKFLKLEPPVFCGLTPFLLWCYDTYLPSWPPLLTSQHQYFQHLYLAHHSLPPCFLWIISFSLLVFICRRVPGIYYPDHSTKHCTYSYSYSQPPGHLHLMLHKTLNSAQQKSKAYIWLCYLTGRHPYILSRTHP